MRYDIVYTDELIYGEDATASLSGTPHPDGHVPAAISVTFYGGAASPVISLTGQLTGKLYGACRISDTIASGETLLFSTDYLDSYVRKLSASGAETDLLSRSISTASRSSAFRSPSPARSPSRRRRRSPARRT